MVQGPRVLLKTWNPLLFFWSLFQKMFSSPLSLLVSFKLSLINILSKDFPSICFLSLTPPMKMFQFVDPIQAIFTEKDLSWDDLVGKKIEAPFKCGCLVVSRCFFFSGFPGLLSCHHPKRWDPFAPNQLVLGVLSIIQ